ncbi:hypothetical protein AB0J63_33700 [Streptosporangium canum]|uniref:hypothetical protein n=1 Tax=Streptosporangium canum TaxID=324952 RepID=UPI0034248A96
MREPREPEELWFLTPTPLGVWRFGNARPRRSGARPSLRARIASARSFMVRRR